MSNVVCPDCGGELSKISFNTASSRGMIRCRKCRKRFSVRVTDEASAKQIEKATKTIRTVLPITSALVLLNLFVSNSVNSLNSADNLPLMLAYFLGLLAAFIVLIVIDVRALSVIRKESRKIWENGEVLLEPQTK